MEPSLTQHPRRLYTLIAGEQNQDFETAEEAWSFLRINVLSQSKATHET